MWVDGQPRVACVTPVVRVRGRQITTLEGLDPAVAGRWGEGFCATGGSQCGFCTPGIIMRLEVLRDRVSGVVPVSPADLDQALLAHLCRCTGWQTIKEAATVVLGAVLPEIRVHPGRESGRSDAGRSDAGRRAELEGGTAQAVGPEVALGRGGFADDTAPEGALVAVLGSDGGWVVGETLTEARRLAGKIQGRRTTAPLEWPIDVPPGDWARVLQTTWVEPGYLEPDASWCEPGGEPASALANGGAFGGKVDSAVGRVARELADRHGRAVRVLTSREDVVRLGPKRPPMAMGLSADGTGVMVVARTAGIAAAVARVAPGIEVIEVDVAGPPTTMAMRGAGWAEAAVALASLSSIDRIISPAGALAEATIAADGSVHVTVQCGAALDDTILRSYCIGAAHMALGWVRHEALTVDSDGEVHDLTIRSFGILRAVDTPAIVVDIVESDAEPVNGSDAVFAAVAAAAWRAAGHPARWPAQRD